MSICILLALGESAVTPLYYGQNWTFKAQRASERVDLARVYDPRSSVQRAGSVQTVDQQLHSRFNMSLSPGD